MKFKSEFGHSYKTYSFGYCQYLEREKKDKLSDIYAEGFLPYSNTTRLKNIFYMARSARIDLKTFALNSENRRVAKRFDNTLKRVAHPIRQFNHRDDVFLSFCENYFTTRHGKGVMTKKRLKTILDAGIISHIIEYRKNDMPIAYVFEVTDEHIGHFWFSFYDLAYINQYLGMWLMIDAIRLAKEEEKKYYYIGTVYGDKALYKTNFDHLEYWNGHTWVADTKALRERSKSDHERTFDHIDGWEIN